MEFVSSGGEQQYAGVVRAADDLVLGLDFDGTLAPIVDDPAAARPDPRAARVLRDLARRWGTVAVVSGRPAGFLSAHLPDLGPARLYGLYGLELAEPGSARIQTRAGVETWRQAVANAAADAEAALGSSAVEHKGLTVTLHYRSDPERQDVIDRLAVALADRYGLRTHPGKMSRELRPPVKVDKGTVLRDLSAGLSAVAFVGDDTGDLPAFEALQAMRRSGLATLAVAVGGVETPAAVLEAGDVVVTGTDGVIAILTALAGG